MSASEAVLHGGLVTVKTLLEEGTLTLPGVESARDDLIPGLLRLALGLGDLEKRDPLLFDVIGLLELPILLAKRLIVFQKI